MTLRREGANSHAVSWGTSPEEQQPTRIDFDAARPKNKQLTIHQSGRVNFKENGRSIYIDPLTLTTRVVVLYQYRIPSIGKLDAFERQPDSDDVIWSLNDLGDGPTSFSLFVGPPDFEPPGKAIKLAYEAEGYALAVSVDERPLFVPEGYHEYFTTLSPERGPYLDQQMSEEQALIAYHRKLTGSNNLILYAPNGEGFVRLIFSVPMRIAPAFRIELTNSELHVTERDIIRDRRSDKVMLRFRVRNRATGQIVREPFSFRCIELDAQL